MNHVGGEILEATHISETSEQSLLTDHWIGDFKAFIIICFCFLEASVCHSLLNETGILKKKISSVTLSGMSPKYGGELARRPKLCEKIFHQVYQNFSLSRTLK